MTFKNSVYDVLKWVCLVFLPALEVFLGILLPTVGVSLEITNMVLKIIPAIATFIGACIGISSVSYEADAKKK